VETEPRVNH